MDIDCFMCDMFLSINIVQFVVHFLLMQLIRPNNNTWNCHYAGHPSQPRSSEGNINISFAGLYISVLDKECIFCELKTEEMFFWFYFCKINQSFVTT